MDPLISFCAALLPWHPVSRSTFSAHTQQLQNKVMTGQTTIHLAKSDFFSFLRSRYFTSCQCTRISMLWSRCLMTEPGSRRFQVVLILVVHGQWHWDLSWAVHYWWKNIRMTSSAEWAAIAAGPSRGGSGSVTWRFCMTFKAFDPSGAFWKFTFGQVQWETVFWTDKWKASRSLHSHGGFVLTGLDCLWMPQITKHTHQLKPEAERN